MPDRMTTFCLRGLENMFIAEDLTFSSAYDLKLNKNIRNEANEYRYTNRIERLY